MRDRTERSQDVAERTVKDIRRKTRKRYSAEEKIRIVLAGLRGEDPIAELCRREGIAQGMYYSWSKEFLEAGKKRLAGDTAREANTGEVKSCAARLTTSRRWWPNRPWNCAFSKKHDRGWGRRRMRYPASEKLEIIRLVEQSHLPAKRTLDTLGVPRTTFYRWYNSYLQGGLRPLKTGRPSRPGCGTASRMRSVTGLSRWPWRTRTCRPGNWRYGSPIHRPTSSRKPVFTGFSKAHDLIASPAFVVIKANDEFRDKTTAPNQLWQTDFTYIKVIGWGWFYLSTILDDYSRYIIAWTLCTTMKASDVTDTLELALQASGCDRVEVRHKPRCCQTMARPTSLANWPNGSTTTAWIMCAAHPITRRHRARSTIPMMRMACLNRIAEFLHYIAMTPITC